MGCSWFTEFSLSLLAKNKLPLGTPNKARVVGDATCLHSLTETKLKEEERKKNVFLCYTEWKNS
jgi:hypothetical protein